MVDENKMSEIFLKYKDFLLSFAYRMTGNLADAEDIIQEAYIELAKQEIKSISNPKSWLTKVTSNKAIDLSRRAYKAREFYPGVWLPDAIPASFELWQNLQTTIDRESQILLAESLTTSFLMLLNKLTPAERAVFLLKDVFGFSFTEISELINKSEVNCRKIAERARRLIQSNRPDPDDLGETVSTKIIEELFEAAKIGDSAKIRTLLAEDSEFWSDGGGKVAVAPRVLCDPDEISKFISGFGKSAKGTQRQFKVGLTKVNGHPGVVISRQESNGLWNFESIFSFEFKNGKIFRIFCQRNPDKLEYLLKRK